MSDSRPQIPRPVPPPSPPPPDGAPHLLVTAGPTHEPIDAVRYIGNRSSGRLGIALSDHAARAGWRVTLLLGPTHLAPSDSHVELHRFRTTADLERLLEEHAPACDALVMAAAVADFRPAPPHPPAPPTSRPVSAPTGSPADGKIKRTDAGLTLHLEPTPDLLAARAARRRPGQLLVGFALEPRGRLLESARDKLARKGVDLIVANPLETMDAPTIEATVVGADGSQTSTDGPIPKEAFAGWLLSIIGERIGLRASSGEQGG